MAIKFEKNLFIQQTNPNAFGIEWTGPFKNYNDTINFKSNRIAACSNACALLPTQNCDYAAYQYE